MRYIAYLLIFGTISTLGAKPFFSEHTFDNYQFFIGIDSNLYSKYKRSVDKTYSINATSLSDERFSYEVIGHPLTLKLGSILYKHHRVYVAHTFIAKHKGKGRELDFGNSAIGYDYIKTINNKFRVYLGGSVSKLSSQNQKKRLYSKYYTTDILLLLNLGVLYHANEDIDIELSYNYGLWQYAYKNYINDNFNGIKNGIYHYDALMDYSTLKLGVNLNF